MALSLRLAATILTVAILGWAVQARGDEPSQKVLRVGYSDFPPYVLTPPGSEPTGFGVDLLHAITAPLGYELTFVRTANPGETLALMQSGDIDVTALLGRSPKREQVADFTAPVDQLDMSILVLRSSGIADHTGLAGKLIGGVAGSTTLAAAQRSLPDAHIVTLNGLPDLMVAILTGDVDAVAIPSGPFLALNRKADVAERLEVLGEPLRTQELSFLVARNRPGVLEDMNAEIAALTSGPQLEEIRDRWFGRDKGFLERTNVRVMLSAGAIAMLALMIGGGVAWQSNRRASRSFAEIGANRLLIDALNGVDFLVVIYDSNLRTVHWNEATAAHFADSIHLLENGITFRELIRTFYTNKRMIHHEPIADLESFAERLERQLLAGQTEPRIVQSANGTIFEATDFRIGTNMYASVRKDVTRIETLASDERRRSLMRFEALFNNAAVGLAQMHFDGGMSKVNGKLASILQCPLDMLTGKKFSDYVDESDRPALMKHIEDVLEGRDAERHTEVRMKSCTRTPLWANVTLSKVARGGTEPGYLVLCVEDVTARHKIEEQRTILLGELSHRVKNILAVVQTITMQTLRSASVADEARDKVFFRLRAISAAHDLVFRSSEQDIASVLQSQMNPFREFGANYIDMAGPSVELPVDLVYSLGLIVHELITNAVKYGALGASSGHVDVRWSVEGHVIHLRWTETGGPQTQPPKAQGFGSRLIKQMVGHTRDGSVEFDFRPTGLVADLRFSLEN